MVLESDWGAGASVNQCAVGGDGSRGARLPVLVPVSTIKFTPVLIVVVPV